MGKTQYDEIIKNGGFNRGLKNEQDKNFAHTNNFEDQINSDNNNLMYGS